MVDSFSSDGTYEKLLANPNVKVIQREFKDFANQRNFAISLATNEWILFIDADERVSETLKSEILEIVSIGSNTSAYKVHRLHYFGDKRIRFSGYQTDSTYRLFKKSEVKYDEKRLVHELPIIRGESGKLKRRK